MRPEELYWTKVALVVGVVVLALLVLTMAGMAKEISNLYAALQKLVT